MTTTTTVYWVLQCDLTVLTHHSKKMRWDSFLESGPTCKAYGLVHEAVWSQSNVFASVWFVCKMGPLRARS